MWLKARRTSSKKFIVKRLDSIQSNQDDATAAIESNAPETGIKVIHHRHHFQRPFSTKINQVFKKNHYLNISGQHIQQTNIHPTS